MKGLEVEKMIGLGIKENERLFLLFYLFFYLIIYSYKK